MRAIPRDHICRSNMPSQSSPVSGVSPHRPCRCWQLISVVGGGKSLGDQWGRLEQSGHPNQGHDRRDRAPHVLVGSAHQERARHMGSIRSTRRAECEQRSETDQFDLTFIEAAGCLPHESRVAQGIEQAGHGLTEGDEVGRNRNGHRV